jgi:hypothetical protein
MYVDCLASAVYEALLESCDGYFQGAWYQNPASSFQFVSSHDPLFALLMDVFMYLNYTQPLWDGSFKGL